MQKKVWINITLKKFQIRFKKKFEYNNNMDTINVTIPEAKVIIQKRKKSLNFELIDVRTEMEYKAGHIDGAINIPLDMIQQKINEFSKDKEYLLYCRTDGRSSYAAQLLKTQGFNVKYITGGYMQWIKN